MNRVELANRIYAVIGRKQSPQVVCSCPFGGFDTVSINNKKAIARKYDISYIGTFSRKTPLSQIRLKLAKHDQKNPR